MRNARLLAGGLVLLATILALVAGCGGSGSPDGSRPSSTWDEMEWDSGIWE